METRAPPMASKNQIEIAELCQIIKELKEQLEGHMHDRLYFDSVTNYYTQEIEFLKEENEILRCRASSPMGFRSYEKTRNSQGSVNDILDPGKYTRARQRAMGMRLNEEKRRRDRERREMNAQRRLF